MPEDVGWAGSWEPMLVSKECLEELRNFAGQPPYEGARMFQINLGTGECSWPRRKRFTSRRSYTKRRR